MDKDKQIQQLLSSLCTQLDDAFEQMGIPGHYAVITSYPSSENRKANHFMTNVNEGALERLLIGAIMGMTEGEYKDVSKGEHLQ